MDAADQIVTTSTEVRKRREIPQRSPLKRYKIGSSARRKQKENHCKFCALNFNNGFYLDEHLKKRIKCREQYMKMLKVSSFDDLSKRLYSCQMCKEIQRIDFRKHLKRNVRCLMEYRRTYCEDDIEDIYKKVKSKNDLRKSYPSYNSKNDEMKTKTISSSLNDYRDHVAFGNYRHCVVCKNNFREYGARPIKESEELFELLGLSSKKCLRRFETFFLCNLCDKDPTHEEVQNLHDSTFLGESVTEDTIKFYPKLRQGEDRKVEESKIKVMFPTCLNAINEELNSQYLKPASKELRKLYGTSEVRRSQVTAIYLNELEKYKQVEKGDLFTATIQNINLKKVENVEKIKSCSRIVGSDDWFKNATCRMKDRQDQFGFLHLTLEMKLVPTCLDVIATCLVQDGIPVTLDKESLPNGEYKNSYKVHTDHTTNEDCSKSCHNKIELDKYIETHNVGSELKNKYVGTYVSSCYQKFYSFSRHILEAPSSELYSENYQLFLMFDENGGGSIIGCVWPKALDNVNAGIAINNGEVDKDSLISFIQRNLCCTGHAGLLMAQLGISEEEATILSELVLKNQLNLTRDSCSLIGMPSLETIFVESCSNTNLIAAKRFLSIVMEKIQGLSVEEKRNKDAFKFLKKVWEDCTGDVSDNFDIFQVEIVESSEVSTIEFEIDARFTEYLRKYDCPFNACYHYALSCCGNQDNSAIVLRRLWIVDCYIEAFNPFWFKAINCSSVYLVKSINKFQDLFLKSKRLDEGDTSDEDISKSLYFSHRFVSLQEALSLADPVIKRVKNSSKEQFVNAIPSRKIILRKTKEHNEENFTISGLEDQFKHMPDVISRHFNREKSDDKILLAETVVWFDFIGSEKSSEIAETYKNIEIPLSEDAAICSCKNLPEYIICKNGDVLKKRRRKKVLILPRYRSEYNLMYSKCLLFLPIQSEVELITSDLKELYEQRNEEGKMLVEKHEKMLFEMKIFHCKDSIENELSALDYLLQALSDNEEDSEDEMCE